MKCVAFLVLLGFASASQLKGLKVQTERESEELTIKMPDTINAEMQLMEEQESDLKRHRKWGAAEPKVELALVQAETNSALSNMLEYGVVHSSLKPIVKAKVERVLNFLQSTKDQFERGTADEKKEMMEKYEMLIMQNSGTRSFNKELCDSLWSESTEAAGQLSYYYCPALVYPPKSMNDMPPLKTLQLEAPGRLRTAYLAQYFWEGMLSNNKKQVISLLEKDACYYWGNKKQGVCGENEVTRTLPYIGFPEGSQLSNPVKWHCDTTTCISPIKAWADHENYCLTTWNAAGKTTEVVVPLDLWR